MFVLPFCIYHYYDRTTNTLHGYIGNSKRVKRPNPETGKLEFTWACQKAPKAYGPWFLYSKFYALSPLIRPIPHGLKLINANKLGKLPYSTKDIEHSYDPFNFSKDSVSFLTWSQSVPDTVPLYIWDTENGSIFPSFDSTIGEKMGWEEDIISPLYVLVDYDEHIDKYDENRIRIRKYPNNNFKFKDINGRCIPDPSGETLDKCFIKTDENIIKTSHEILDDRNIFSELEDEEEEVKKERSYIAIFLVILFFTFIFGILYYLKSTKFKTKRNIR